MVVLSVRAYCSATPPWYAAAAVRTAVLALDAREQRALGVDAELVAVAGDRGLEELGVRREDERRELGHRRVEQELRLHRVPVLRVEVGAPRAVDAEAEPAQWLGLAAGASSESQPASSAAAPPARPAPSTARRDEMGHPPIIERGGWVAP